MAKVKERISSAAREKQRVIHKRISIQLSPDFFAETLQVRGEQHYIFKVLKGKNLQLRILYSTRLSFTIEREKKIFSDKEKQ